ncbi:Peptidoglycan/LPS O-acetylase OafA/YrhL, contains acyltransferase and SGNH-hydrolase domains [Paenibacillus sp. UNCCL117]|uniref:acyltransferase family protein n=1 Tax=unclassified Paenibacillus TaxID=185978 RepID=UPI00088304B0|nr:MULTISPECIES: acyltransferase [unclassified Paenibacillus]SDD49399.1 Peptidoglycan/LPS O-acetylase OafA/YrhL, contains acyltransferase and SGNH-hydrolase domains [Paenibacillus sp. cl123]SFW49985.1 Peptidoglycan/LPS O-acetylase OafA/YrhL, contains acyltransferase and SGNH-hydrolase domains [Paenibacillus sp. UNCCL117]
MKRYEELDSLRGLAALTVLINHLLILIPISMWTVTLIKYPVINIFWQGHSAVLFFFILSGFVLSLPFLRGSDQTYAAYLIKRFCRIYLPYVIAITVGIIACLTLSNGTGFPGLSVWFNKTWTSKITPELVLNHYLFIGSYNTDSFIPAIWSLIHEMRISIVFPFIMLVVLRFNWIINISIALASSIIGYFFYYLSWHHKNLYVSVFDVFNSLEYLPMFILGALLAKYREKITSFLRKLSKFSRMLLLLLGMVLYTYNSFLSEIKLLHFAYMDDWAISFGACLFIALSLSSNNLSRFLLTSPIRFLGKTSYSMYLWHEVILFSLIHVFYGKIPLWVISLSTIGSSLLVSGVMYKIFEEPTIKLGRFLTRNNNKEFSRKTA